jgi:hypothetical protein
VAAQIGELRHYGTQIPLPNGPPATNLVIR